MIPIDQKTPQELQEELAQRVRARRKEMRFSQEKLAKKAQVSLGSLKRFEGTGEISLVSLTKLAVALRCEQDIEALFARKQYLSIQDVIDEQSKS